MVSRAQSAPTLQRILLTRWREFSIVHRQPAEVHRAAYLLAHCRTAVLGGHVKRCVHGHVEAVYYNSCRHRCCPACSALPRAAWLARWQAKMLDCAAHHVVFTVPQELVPLWRMNKRHFAGALFGAAKDSLLTLLADPEYLGALPGLLGTMHTWSQTLSAHPHVHFIVTSGGLAGDGSWKTPKRECLLPRKVLMILFRGKLLARLGELLGSGKLLLPEGVTQAECQSLFNKLGRATWNVKLLERYAHARGVSLYLAKYLRGGPIGNRRLLGYRGGSVTFRYLSRPEGQAPRHARLKLPADEFLRRWSQHVPPAGMHTVRAYGLYATGQRAKLNLARSLLAQAPFEPEVIAAPGMWVQATASALLSTCPTCNAQLVSLRLVHQPQARPWQRSLLHRSKIRLRAPPAPSLEGQS